MKQHTHTFFWAYLTVPLIAYGLLFGAQLFQNRQLERELKTPFGRYTPREIVDHTLPLLGALGFQADHLRFNPTPRTAYTNGNQHHLWEVEGNDNSGNFCVICFWDADTGTLLSMGRAIAPTIRSSPSLPREARLHIAQHWCSRLFPAAFASPVTISTGADYEDTEQYTWKHGSMQANFYIDKITGDLLSFNLHPSPEAHSQPLP